MQVWGRAKLLKAVEEKLLGPWHLLPHMVLGLTGWWNILKNTGEMVHLNISLCGTPTGLRLAMLSALFPAIKTALWGTPLTRTVSSYSAP